MKITTFNANGIRSASRRNFWDWVSQHRPDILCMQEVRAYHEQFPQDALQASNGYRVEVHSAAKPGYSGVATFSLEKPLNTITKFGTEWIDLEGRLLLTEYSQVWVLNTYFPSGSSSPERQQKKILFMEWFHKYWSDFLSKNSDKPLIICGDVNIAHQEIDLTNWKANQEYPGFTLEERQWLGKLLESIEYVDTFRYLLPEERRYTWWSARGAARSKNVGWRIDYQFIGSKFKESIKSAIIHDRSDYFSDHAPYTVDYAFNTFST